MANTTSPEQKNQEYRALGKKLRKREQRLSGRLQEARAAQTSALKRFQRAEARLLKRMARTQRIESRLAMLRQEVEAFTTATGITLHPITSSYSEEQDANDTGELLLGNSLSDVPVFEDEEKPYYTREGETDSLKRTHSARALVEATEEATRLTVERAHTVAARLEHTITGRHLTQELLTHEAEVARDNETASNDEEISTPAMIQNDGTLTNEAETHLHSGLPSQVERERVSEIDEEEEMVEMVAAMMIADVAAVNAAKVEALAEEASARTREARRFAQEADAVLERIRAAIKSGTASGDAAEAILFDAERDTTHAHAMLADAESTEERAQRAAMEAEAEAEVAEGMAFAAGDRNEHAEMQREEEPLPLSSFEGQQPSNDTGEVEQLNAVQTLPDKNFEDGNTIEIPFLHPHS